MRRETSDKPATELVLGFVNTRPTGNGDPERLGDARALRLWAEAAGLGAVRSCGSPTRTRPSPGSRATRWRCCCSPTWASRRTRGAPADAEDRLRRVAELYPLVTVVTASGCALVPSQRGMPGVFGSLFRSRSRRGGPRLAGERCRPRRRPRRSPGSRVEETS